MEKIFLLVNILKVDKIFLGFYKDPADIRKQMRLTRLVRGAGGVGGPGRGRHALHGARRARVVVELLHGREVHRVGAAQRAQAHLLLARRRARL